MAYIKAQLVVLVKDLRSHVHVGDSLSVCLFLHIEHLEKCSPETNSQPLSSLVCNMLILSLAINQMQWLMIPACPSICFFKKEGANSFFFFFFLKIIMCLMFMFCNCFIVLCLVCLCRVDWRKDLCMRRVLKCAFAFDRV